MPIVTLDIPEERYSAFLRFAADYLDGVAVPERRERGRIEFEDDTDAEPWSMKALDETDDDFQLLVTYLKKLKGISAAVFDYLGENPGPVDGDTLAAWLQVTSRRAVAGSLGHAARFANELGRDFPINSDRESGSYWLDEDMREAVQQARIWAVPSPYDYFVEINNRHLRYRSDDTPARYAVYQLGLSEDPADDLIGFFYDENAVIEHVHSDAMRHDAEDFGFLRVEFTPDVVHRRHLVPREDHDDLGARTERSHDLVTWPVADGFSLVEVLTA